MLHFQLNFPNESLVGLSSVAAGKELTTGPDSLHRADRPTEMPLCLLVATRVGAARLMEDKQRPQSWLASRRGK